MKLLSVLVVLCLAYFNGVSCQVYISVYNGTIPSQNHSGLYSYNNTYNATNYNNGRPNYNIPSYNYNRPIYHHNPPSFLGKGYNNRSNNNCSNAYGDCANNGTNLGHLWLGTIQIYDRLLFNKEYNLVSHWWTSRDVKVVYPDDSVSKTYRTHERITAIRIYNKYHGKSQSYAKIKEGGIGAEFVKIKLYSGAMGKGLHYLVQIFGH